MTTADKEKRRQWTCEQIEKYRALHPTYQRYAQTLNDVLTIAVKSCAPLAIVQTRPKSIASYAEKIQRKKKYRDPVNQITDLCGGRVITHTHSEVEAVCQFVEQHFDIDWANSVDVSQRLKPTEFGYRSIHYVVQFRPGVFPTREIDVEIPDDLMGLKSEIQVRTLAEHAWASFSHDKAYKGAFTIPDKWQRELASLAAMLEEADRAFSRIQAGLRTYAASYGAYMTREQMQDEIELLKTVLECDPGNLDLAHRIGKLAMTLGDWQQAIDIFSQYASSGHQPILRDLGVAMCKVHFADPRGSEYRQGQAYLEAACAEPQADADALASLAGTWKGLDEDQARILYRRAFEADPSDPYALSNYLVFEIARQRDASLSSLMAPAIEAAMQRCRDQAAVGMNLPWAFYNMGIFHLLLGRPYESLTAYARAIQLTTDGWMIETSLRLLDRLAGVREELAGFEWMRRILNIGWAAKFPAAATQSRLSMADSTWQQPISLPVLIVAGGTDPSVEEKLQTYSQLLLEGLRDFRGTVISGGTTAGIAGLVGLAQEAYGDSLHTIGYLPALIPAGVTVDRRYRELRHTAGHDFSALEALQYWTDLLVSGVNLSEVRLLGLNGGIIAAAEYRLALALGARVAVVSDSGRAAAQLLSDDDWRGSAMLVSLPRDPMTLRAFVGSGTPRLAAPLRETLARAVHDAYRHIQASRLTKEDLALAEWEALMEDLKESNRQQADHIVEKLRQIGYTVEPAPQGQAPRLVEFTPEQIESMAEMEQARWNTERLLSGWTYGEKRDPVRKTSPYLLPWSQLPEDAKAWNRETVRRIPEFLAGVGLAARREGSPG